MAVNSRARDLLVPLVLLPLVVPLMIAAAGAGLIAIELLLGYVRQHDYTIFVVYRLCLAAAILIIIATGVREATF